MQYGAFQKFGMLCFCTSCPSRKDPSAVHVASPGLCSVHDAVKVSSMQVARKPHLLRVSFLSVYATVKALLYVSLVVLTEDMIGCGLPLSRYAGT